MDNPLGNRDLTNKTLGGYKMIKKLGMGAFGEIYLATKNKQEFAIKLERTNCEFPQIIFEGKVYSFLHADATVDKGIPKVYGAATEGDYNYLVMEVLGESLEDLFNRCNRRFSLKSVLMLGESMITRLEFMHSRSFIHRDVKPDNFLMGTNSNSHRVYVVDMGLAKRYITKEGHIPYREGKPLTGTARYASINTHLGYEQSRRDDLEGLAYVLVYLVKGQLPWMNLRCTNQNDKYIKIKEKKIATTPEQLCSGLPQEFIMYLKYVRNLRFEEKPDYNYLRSLFKTSFTKAGYKLDYVYDWTKDPRQQTQSQREIETVKAIKKEEIKEQLKDVKNIKEANEMIIQMNKTKENFGKQKEQLSPKIENKKLQSPPAKQQIQNPQRIQSAQRQPAKPPVKKAPQNPPRLQSAHVNAPRIVLNKEPYTKF